MITKPFCFYILLADHRYRRRCTSTKHCCTSSKLRWASCWCWSSWRTMYGYVWLLCLAPLAATSFSAGRNPYLSTSPSIAISIRNCRWIFTQHMHSIYLKWKKEPTSQNILRNIGRKHTCTVQITEFNWLPNHFLFSQLNYVIFILF